MTFISGQFVAFFAAVVVVHFCLPFRVRWAWLLATSTVFYATFGPIFVLQIAAASGVAYLLALRIEAAEEPRRKGWLLAAGLAAVIANLLVFKYTWFINESLRAVVALFGVDYPVPVIRIVLPIGISFYTFQLISYLVDVYRGEKAERHFGVFALYMMFFTKIIAGPIERARNLIPQLKADHAFDYARVVAGLQLIVWGLFKKVVVADRLAPIVNHVYDAPQNFDGVAFTFATWLYAFQIYCDFSGYTDMALGGALILGFKLTQNFNRPYHATSIQDFWKRWHISLTSWLTDYIFNPLIRSKFIRIKWYYLMLASMLVTFLASGLWHGAQWTFVCWGALHGTYIVIGLLLQKPFNQAVARLGLLKRPQLYRGLKIALTFSLVCFAYILFRANSMADAVHIIAQLPTGWDSPAASLQGALDDTRAQLALGLAGIGVVVLADIVRGRVDVGAAIAQGPAWRRWGLYYAGGLSIALLGAFYQLEQQFIYFRF